MAEQTGTEPEVRRWGRRAFLAALGGGALTAVGGKPVWNVASRPLTATAGLLPSGLRDLLPLDGWRVYAVSSPMPRFDPVAYRLRVSGLVARPLELSFADLRALPRARQTADFHCVTGWSVDDCRWQGFRLGPLLERAGIAPSARALEFVSLEQPYVDTLTLDQALAPDVLVAHTLDDRPLTREHGSPLRVVIPQMYGYKGVKWLAEIRVVAAAHPGYWEQRGYDVDGFVGRSNGLG